MLVFPAPRNPVITVAGMRVLMGDGLLPIVLLLLTVPGTSPGR